MQIKCLYEELLPLHKIIENPKNPNQHFPEKIKILANNIDYQGIRWPIIISKRSGFVVAGHGRLLAAQLLGYDSYPVVFQDFESEAQEYEFLVADNKLAELSETNESKIKEELKLLPDVKMEMLGFEDQAMLIEVDDHEMPEDLGSEEYKEKELNESNVKTEKLCPNCGCAIK